ncbi:MAG: histidine ammonia-lyase [Thermoplasmata archaeon]
MILITGNDLTIDQVIKVAKNRVMVKLSEGAKKRIEYSRKIVEKKIVGGDTIYGVNTGFGDLVNVKISRNDAKNLQMNLIRSHSSGFGKAMDEETVRAMILVRANALAKGYSGVRVEVVELLLNLLNKNIYPYIPEKGSVGSSGDLSPLAHLALVLVGEGHVIYEGQIISAGKVLEEKGIKTITLEEKEGIALINGTSFMLSNLIIAIHEAKIAIEHSVISSGLSMHTLSATDRSLCKHLFEARPYEEQMLIASYLQNFIEGSNRIEKGREEKVQDAYSLRCIPTVIGSVLQVYNYVSGIMNIELNSATDNPLVFDDIVSGCNFHGEPLAMASDFLSIAMTELGNIAERRIFRIVDKNLSQLKAFLADNPGLESGMMIPQYVAASLCNENKVLVYPSSADTIPTSANQEDHVSMGATSVRKLRQIIENVNAITAIEMMINYKAMRMYGHEGKYISIIYNKIKEKVPEIQGDIETTFIIKEFTKIIEGEYLLDAIPTITFI